MPIFREPTLDDIRRKGPAGRDPRTGRFRSNDPGKRLVQLSGSYTRQASYKYKKVCPVCGREFYAARSSRVTCSDSCRGKKHTADKHKRAMESLPEAARKYLEEIGRAVPAAADNIKQLMMSYGSPAALLALQAIQEIRRASRQATANTAQSTSSVTSTSPTSPTLPGNAVKQRQ